MTFWYDEELDELIGNVASDYAYFDGEELHIDVTTIMEEGRGFGKLEEMQFAIDDAIDAHDPNLEEGCVLTYIDGNSEEHEAVVTKVWSRRTINLAYAGDDGQLVYETSVTRQEDSEETFCWHE